MTNKNDYLWLNNILKIFIRPTKIKEQWTDLSDDEVEYYKQLWITKRNKNPEKFDINDIIYNGPIENDQEYNDFITNSSYDKSSNIGDNSVIPRTLAIPIPSPSSSSSPPSFSLDSASISPTNRNNNNSENKVKWDKLLTIYNSRNNPYTKNKWDSYFSDNFRPENSRIIEPKVEYYIIEYLKKGSKFEIFVKNNPEVLNFLTLLPEPLITGGKSKTRSNRYKRTIKTKRVKKQKGLKTKRVKNKKG